MFSRCGTFFFSVGTVVADCCCCCYGGEWGGADVVYRAVVLLSGRVWLWLSTLSRSFLLMFFFAISHRTWSMTLWGMLAARHSRTKQSAPSRSRFSRRHAFTRRISTDLERSG